MSRFYQFSTYFNNILSSVLEYICNIISYFIDVNCKASMIFLWHLCSLFLRIEPIHRHLWQIFLQQSIEYVRSKRNNHSKNKTCVHHPCNSNSVFFIQSFFIYIFQFCPFARFPPHKKKSSIEIEFDCHLNRRIVNLLYKKNMYTSMLNC